MKDTRDLIRALDEMVACGQRLILAADLIREHLELEGPAGSIPAASQAEEPAVPETTDAAPAETPAKAYTLIEVREAFSAKARDGHTEEIRALIGRYGAAKLSEIREEDYPALMADLEVIG